MGKIIEALTQNSPLALVAIGLFLVIIGAAGGWPQPPLQVHELGWRIVLAALGAIVAGLGGLLMWRGNSPQEVAAPGRKYGIEILSPSIGLGVDKEVEVIGTYKKKPPAESLALVEFSPQSQRYHFKKSVMNFSEERKQWSSVISLGGMPGQPRDIVVVVLGKGGKALSEYYNYIIDQTTHWQGVKTLTPDIVECRRVRVIRK